MVGSSVERNLIELNERIAVACSRADRVRGDVILLAVSKTKPLAAIDEAVSAGQCHFGENYVQEAVAKADARPDLDWHFIGSLQTNKVKDVVGRFALIHSVDRVKLAREISKEALKKGIVQDILLQIHVGDEESKQGFEPKDAAAALQEILRLPAMRVRGLMCLPPLAESEAQGRAYFREVRELLDRLRPISPSATEFSVLSMGTTHDFEWAILEGATHVRIGTAIFGERDRKA